MLGHLPVLLRETLAGLAVKPSGRYIDATYGRGGHATAILEQLSTDGHLLVLDRDPQAVDAACAAHGGDARVSVMHEAFANLNVAADRLGWLGQVDGLLFDIGVSSPQLEQPERGFSFQSDGPLDMRMDPGSGETAAEWLQRADVVEIGQVLKKYGEEKAYKRLSRAIVEAREDQPIQTTAQLATLISKASPAREPGRHPATKVFQALRIYINDELRQLEAALDHSIELLAPGGRLCVISFHSLEDRIVKRFMRRHSLADPMWRGLPDIPEHMQPDFERPARAARASSSEVMSNPRSRSAVLRVVERRL